MTFVRYVIIQLVTYAIDVGVFLVIFELMMFGPLLSNVFAKCAAGLIAFILHRNFTFEVANEEPHTQAIKYSVLLSLNIPIASATLALFLLFISHVVAAKLLADAAGVFLTYGLSKYLVFSRAKKEIIGRVKK